MTIKKITQDEKRSPAWTYKYVYSTPQVVEVENEGLYVVGFGNCWPEPNIQQAEDELAILKTYRTEEAWNKRYKNPQ